MYNIYDILEEIDFNLVNKELEFVKVYDSNRVVHLNFYIKHNGEVIFYMFYQNPFLALLNNSQIYTIHLD